MLRRQSLAFLWIPPTPYFSKHTTSVKKNVSENSLKFSGVKWKGITTIITNSNSNKRFPWDLHSGKRNNVPVCPACPYILCSQLCVSESPMGKGSGGEIVQRGRQSPHPTWITVRERVSGGVGSLCWAEAEGDGGEGTWTHSRRSPLSRINDRWKEGEGDEAILPIDCLIAPVAVCLRPLAKSVIIFEAKVRLGRFPCCCLLLNRSAPNAQPGWRNMVHVDF